MSCKWCDNDGIRFDQVGFRGCWAKDCDKNHSSKAKAAEQRFQDAIRGRNPKSSLPRVYESRTYLQRGYPFSYASITNFGDGMGLLQIHSDWGPYTAFWAAIGKDATLEEFLLECDPSYLRKNLLTWLNFMGLKKEGERNLDRFLIECWPKLRQVIEEEYTLSKMNS